MAGLMLITAFSAYVTACSVCEQTTDVGEFVNVFVIKEGTQLPIKNAEVWGITRNENRRYEGKWNPYPVDYPCECYVILVRYDLVEVVDVYAKVGVITKTENITMYYQDNIWYNNVTFEFVSGRSKNVIKTPQELFFRNYPQFFMILRLLQIPILYRLLKRFS